MFNHHLIKRSLAAAAVIATAGFPSAAQAMFVDGAPGQAIPVASPLSVSHPTATSHSTFEWGDAGIGAAGATVLVGAAVLGATVTRRRRDAIAG
jgi:hypothetical protein